jgi:hypothetical protein
MKASEEKQIDTLLSACMKQNQIMLRLIEIMKQFEADLDVVRLLAMDDELLQRRHHRLYTFKDIIKDLEDLQGFKEYVLPRIKEKQQKIPYWAKQDHSKIQSKNHKNHA